MTSPLMQAAASCLCSSFDPGEFYTMSVWPDDAEPWLGANNTHGSFNQEHWADGGNYDGEEDAGELPEHVNEDGEEEWF